MAIKLTEGSYPQIPSKFTVLDSKQWTEKTLLRKGHKLLQLRLKEMTLRSEGYTHSISEKKLKPPTALKEIAHAMLDTTRRYSGQYKTTPRLNTRLISVAEGEKALRAWIDEENADVTKGKKRIGANVTLFIQHMITEKNGMICWWTLINKAAEGLYMILVKVDGKHVGRMNAQERANAMDLTWADQVCDITAKDIQRNEKQLQCPNSGAGVRSL